MNKQALTSIINNFINEEFDYFTRRLDKKDLPVLVTGNKGKLADFKAANVDLENVDFDSPEIQAIDPRQVTRTKAFHVAKILGKPVVTDDSGLGINALKGYPGALVKWLEKATGPEGIYDLGKKHGTSSIATSALGIAHPDMSSEDDVVVLSGDTHGDVVSPRGTHGFSWETIFQQKGHDRTFAEMPPEEKRLIATRTQSAALLRKLLFKENLENIVNNFINEGLIQHREGRTWKHIIYLG